MAYDFHVSSPIRSQLGGKQYLCFTVTEVDVGAANEWTIGCLPEFFTITLFEAAVQTGPPSETINPRLATAPAAEAGPIDEVAENAKAAASVRMTCSLRVTSPAHRLVGRSSPTVGGTTKVVTRITMVEGH